MRSDWQQRQRIILFPISRMLTTRYGFEIKGTHMVLSVCVFYHMMYVVVLIVCVFVENNSAIVCSMLLRMRAVAEL